MNQRFASRIAFPALAIAALFVCAGRMNAKEIGGGPPITSTVYLFEDTELVGDVTCAVPITLAGANPCIAFAADHIELHLNGHTITGPVTPPTGCSLPTDTMYGVGIEAIDRNDVKIEGPGIIQHFERWGILVGLTGHPSSEVTVRRATIYHNCWSGMQTFSTSDSVFEENVFADDAGGSNGASCGGTWLSGSSNNRVRLNTFYGNGAATSKSSPSSPSSNNFGLGLINASQNNLVENNRIGGNINGVYLGGGGQVTGNIIRRNIIAGNPAAQVLTTFGPSIGADIQDHSSSGANSFEENYCLTYSGAGPSPCPNVRTPEGDQKR